MNRRAFLSVLLLGATSATPPLERARPVPVSADRPDAQFVETTIAAHPRDANSLIAAAVVLGKSATSVRVYASADGGQSWRAAVHRGNAPIPPGSLDPWVLFLNDGTALFTYLAGTRADNFAVSRSRDGGRTWSAPAFVPGGVYDRQFLVEDASPASRFRGRVYALGKINISRLSGRPFQAIAISDSLDQGRTFSSPRLFVPPDDRDPLIVAANAVVTRDGTLVLPFTTVIRPADADTMLDYGLWTTTSSDGGRTFEAPSLVTRRVVAKSEGLRYSSVPSVAIDTSAGSHDGQIYLAWSLARQGGYDIQVWRSNSNGTAWFPAVRVNDNPRPAGHVNPALAVNARGEIAVAWYDRRDSAESNCHQVFFAQSSDGGGSFSPNTAVTEARTCVNSQRFANVGDTLGVTASPGGRFDAVFVSGLATSDLQLYYSPLIVITPHGR